jgi:hypothetical protein
VVDYQQRGALIIIGGDINSSGSQGARAAARGVQLSPLGVHNITHSLRSTIMRQYSECPPTLLDLRAESLSTPGENATLNYAPPGMGESMLYEVSQARAIKSFSCRPVCFVWGRRTTNEICREGGDENGVYRPRLYIYKVGVRYYNINVTLGRAAKRCGWRAGGSVGGSTGGELMAGNPSGNTVGSGSAVPGTGLTLGQGAADDTISRFVAHRGGGGLAQTTQAGYTATGVGTTAKAVMELEQNAALVVVAGTDGSNSFVDLVLTGNQLPPTVVGGNPASGHPAARTYTVSGFALKLAMASGSYRTNTHSLQLAAR